MYKRQAFINFLNENDTVLYVDLYHDWFHGKRENLLKQIKNKNICTICFGQEKKHLEEYADILYIYGIENSVNDGCLLYTSKKKGNLRLRIIKLLKK